MPSSQTHDNIDDGWLGTCEGKFLYDDPSTVDYRDIARSLSRTPRYFGHTTGFFSVAQHSIACSKLAEARGMGAETQFIALMHDAAEAYCGDLARPLKERLEKYNEIIEQVEANIAEHFGFEYPYPEEIREIDLRVYWYERRGISDHPDIDASEVPAPPPAVAQVLSGYWRPNKAWNEFLSRYKLLQR